MEVIEEEKTANIPKWFKKVNERSWEAELLISGGAAFALFQVTESLLILFTKTNVSGSEISVLLTEFPLFSLLTLTGGFFIHLIIRAFWLAIVMLGRIYPHGINFEKLNLAAPYLDESKRFDIFLFAERLDKICSLVFVWTITLTILIVGWALSVTVVLVPLFYIAENDPSFTEPVFIVIRFVSIVFMFGFVAFTYFDLFTSGWLRRGKFIPKIYFPVYKFYNAISMGFVWRPVLQTLTTNLKKKKRTVFLIIFGYFFTGTILVFLMGLSLHGIPVNLKEKLPIPIFKASLYRDEQPDGNLSIQSKVVTQNHLEIFVSYDFRWRLDKSLRDNSKFLNNLSIIVNDSIYRNRDWIGLEDREDQPGITTIVPIRHLPSRKHILKVVSGRDTTSIPFWKQ